LRLRVFVASISFLGVIKPINKAPKLLPVPCHVYSVPGSAVCAILWKPVNRGDDLRRQLHTSFADLEAFVVHAALTADDIQVAAGDPGGDEAPAPIDRFLETAEPAALAGCFPVGHCCGSVTRIRCW
jgi:hypothetical protein